MNAVQQNIVIAYLPSGPVEFNTLSPRYVMSNAIQHGGASHGTVQCGTFKLIIRCNRVRYDEVLLCKIVIVYFYMSA